MVSKKAKAEAPGTAPHTAPKTREATNRASLLKCSPKRPSDSSSPLSNKRVKQESTMEPNLQLESHEAAIKGTDIADAMASQYQDASLQGEHGHHHNAQVIDHDEVNSVDIASNCDNTAMQDDQARHDEAQVAGHDEVNSADMVGNYDNTTVQDDQARHDEAQVASHDEVDSADMVGNYDNTTMQDDQARHDEAQVASHDEVDSADMVGNCDNSAFQSDQVPRYEVDATINCEIDSADSVNNHHNAAQIDLVRSNEKEVLSAGQSPCYEDDVAGENAPPTTEGQIQRSPQFESTANKHGTLLLRWPFADPEGENSPLFTRDEFHRLRIVSLYPETGTLEQVNVFVEALQEATSHIMDRCTCIPWDELSVVDQHKLKSLGNNIESYWKSGFKIYQALPIMSLTWHILLENLFSLDCAEKWYGEAWKNHAAMMAYFKERLKDPSSPYANWFHAWRFESARMVFAFSGDSSNPDRTKEILMEQLGKVITIPAEANEALGDVVQKATRLETALRTSPCCYKFGMHHPGTLERSGFAFLGQGQLHTYHRDYPIKKGTTVGLIYSPWTHEYGAASWATNGSFFDRFHLKKVNTLPMMVYGQATGMQGETGAHGNAKDGQLQ
ncbi:hypothetical protein EDB81DRAFT_860617 [Dactylonectria macrodidyma]|uniref:Uncharacterized protein n=1 Tax=Dactylonectria macrodidyma TaxID=307937 RepID=A0A9P9DVE6_9HYPO|nr:hypothetical protein EDB81DRAFT_860617 [Dactylonectria macrodidyma]